MEFDIFFSICQTEVDGYTPDEKTMCNQIPSEARDQRSLSYGRS